MGWLSGIKSGLQNVSSYLSNNQPQQNIKSTPAFAFTQEQTNPTGVQHQLRQLAPEPTQFEKELGEISATTNHKADQKFTVKTNGAKTKEQYDQAFMRAGFERVGLKDASDREVASFRYKFKQVAGESIGFVGDEKALRAATKNGKVDTSISQYGDAVFAAGARDIYRNRQGQAAKADQARQQAQQYGTDALKGWGAIHANVPINIVNAATEPVRGIAAAAGVNIPAIPRFTAADNSEYWQTGNKGKMTEAAGTIVAGAAAGNVALATKTGQVVASVDAMYNAAVGAAGVDPTQGNREIGAAERTLRVTGAVVAAAGVSNQLGTAGRSAGGASTTAAEAVTTTGQRVRMSVEDEPLAGMVMESRGRKMSSGGGQRYEERMRASLPELDPAQFKKVLDGDKLVQAKKIQNLEAADHIGFREEKGKYVAVITEFTTGNKPLAKIAAQLRGAQRVAMADKELSLDIKRYEYRVVTDNEGLVKELKAKKNLLKIYPKADPVRVEVLFRR